MIGIPNGHLFILLEQQHALRLGAYLEIQREVLVYLTSIAEVCFQRFQLQLKGMIGRIRRFVAW